MFWDRFSELCKKNGVTPNAVCSTIGKSTATATHWKNGSTPNGDVLIKIAEYFNVPVDYLLGRTDDPNQKPGETNIRFDEFEFAMHNETKDLSDDDKNMLLDMARILKNRVMKKNNSKE